MADPSTTRAEGVHVQPHTTFARSLPSTVVTHDWQHIEDLTAIQDARLVDTLAWAARSPFYRRRGRVPTDRAGLGRLPLTTKQDLRDGYPCGLLAVGPEAVATYHESSGTSGGPTPSFYTPGDWADVEERYARKWV